MFLSSALPSSLLLLVAFCTLAHKHEYGLNIIGLWGQMWLCVTTFVTETVAFSGQRLKVLKAMSSTRQYFSKKALRANALTEGLKTFLRNVLNLGAIPTSALFTAMGFFFLHAYGSQQAQSSAKAENCCEPQSWHDNTWQSSQSSQSSWKLILETTGTIGTIRTIIWKPGFGGNIDIWGRLQFAQRPYGQSNIWR